MATAFPDSCLYPAITSIITISATSATQIVCTLATSRNRARCGHEVVIKEKPQRHNDPDERTAPYHRHAIHLHPHHATMGRGVNKTRQKLLGGGKGWQVCGRALAGVHPPQTVAVLDRRRDLSGGKCRDRVAVTLVH